jgi:hypothetical protein
MFERIPLPLARATDWSSWPFGGFGENFLPAAARMLFVLALFAAIALLLRWLFGPGGRLRPAEFGADHIAPRRERQARIRELRARCKRGEISMDEYLAESRRIREEGDRKPS